MDTKLTRSGLVMVSFLCQFDRAMGCPNIELDILGESVRVFLDDINI